MMLIINGGGDDGEVTVVKIVETMLMDHIAVPYHSAIDDDDDDNDDDDDDDLSRNNEGERLSQTAPAVWAPSYSTKLSSVTSVTSVTKFIFIFKYNPSFSVIKGIV